MSTERLVFVVSSIMSLLLMGGGLAACAAGMREVGLFCCGWALPFMIFTMLADAEVEKWNRKR